MTTSKPIVHYVPHADDIIEVGRNARVVKVLDHPTQHPENRLSNRLPMITTKVVRIEEAFFETQNTIYARTHYNA